MNRIIAAHKAVSTRNKNKAGQWEKLAIGLKDQNDALRRQIAAYKAWSVRKADQTVQ